MTDVLVIHDLGADGGAPWREAFRGWDGVVHTPDLPGHGDAPPPVGGHHELGDVVFAILARVELDTGSPPVVVGVGRSGNAARLLALAGRASALVLVDGLGGPWLDVPARNAALRDTRRQILATPEALEPHRPGHIDVRATLVLGQTDRRHVIESLAAVPVPTLVLETPSSPTGDAVDVASVIPDHHLVTIDPGTPADVAREVRDWLTTRSMPSPS